MTIEAPKEESVVLRHSQFLTDLDPVALRRASLGERAEIRICEPYSDCSIGLLDFSSHSTTNTFKDWVACVTIAFCLQEGIGEFVTQSSGNTGNALARYASQQGIQLTVLYPRCSRYKIDPTLANRPGITFVELDKSEPEMGDLTREYSEYFGLPWLPNWDLQIQSNKIRAFFLQNYLAEKGQRFTWHVQSISGGYGIFGFYQGLDEIRALGLPEGEYFPRFLGVQQESVAPYFTYLEDSTFTPTPDPLEPTLFRKEPPAELLKKMKDLCARSRGRITVLRDQEYHRNKKKLVPYLRRVGIELGRLTSSQGTPVLEKSGQIALLGAFSCIDRGVIPRGDSVLVAFTGGAGSGRSAVFSPTLKLAKEEGPQELLALGRGVRQSPNHYSAISVPPT
ncbi:MAG: pyridoxal-phosphate dependent enzyme [Deltaproteobacteria bacterium]|nr:pyridoxal-phosphate dependent enzyme [Deltaproteobacteria bacterium]